MIKLDNIPTTIRDGKQIYDWKNSIGNYITAINETTEEKIKCPIIRYENKKIYVKHDNEEIPIHTGHIENCKCGKIFKTYTPDYLYDIGQIIGNRKITNRSKEKSQMKFYEWECIDCKTTGKTQEQAMLSFEKNNHRCTIPFTDPWMIPYFKGGYKEANKYTAQSNKRFKPICPYCGMQSETYKRIYNVYMKHGFQCVCSDNISYGEKFFMSFLNQVGVKYTHQFYAEWNNRYYDFYIPSLNAVTEIHGEQHYVESESFTKRSIIEEQENDKMKEETALQQDFINRYFIIDARNSTKEWLENHIKESEVYRLLGSPEIDWNECHQYTIKNVVIEVCKYIMEHPTLSPQEYADILSIKRSTIDEYIKIGKTHFEWFTWEHYSKNIEVVRNNQVLFITHTFSDARRFIESNYNIHMLESEIRRTYIGKYKQYKGFQFREAM